MKVIGNTIVTTHETGRSFSCRRKIFRSNDIKFGESAETCCWRDLEILTSSVDGTRWRRGPACVFAALDRLATPVCWELGKVGSPETT